MRTRRWAHPALHTCGDGVALCLPGQCDAADCDMRPCRSAEKSFSTCP